MSEENVEIIRRVYPGSKVDIARLVTDEDAWARFEAPLLPFVHSSFEATLDPAFAALSETTRERNLKGVDAFRDLWRDWLSAWESFRLDVKDLRPLAGSRVLALVDMHARPKTGDVEMSLQGAAIWTLADAQVSRVQVFLDRDRALEAAGLSE